MTTSTDDARIVLPDGAAVPARIPAGIFAAAVIVIGRLRGLMALVSLVTRSAC